MFPRVIPFLPSCPFVGVQENVSFSRATKPELKRKTVYSSDKLLVLVRMAELLLAAPVTIAFRKEGAGSERRRCL